MKNKGISLFIFVAVLCIGISLWLKNTASLEYNDGVSAFVSDSLVMVEFYNATKGSDWKNKWDFHVGFPNLRPV